MLLFFLFVVVFNLFAVSEKFFSLNEGQCTLTFTPNSLPALVITKVGGQGRPRSDYSSTGWFPAGHFLTGRPIWVSH